MDNALPDRTQRRVAEMRRKLIAIAEEILIEEGPESLNNESVAERADVAVQTVYNRIGGKQAMLLAIAEKALADNRRIMNAAYDAPGTSEDRIRGAFRAYVRFAKECPYQFQLLQNPPPEPTALGQIENLVNEQNGKLAQALIDGQKEGFVRSDFNPHALATTLWAMVNGVLSVACCNHPMKPSDAEVDNVLLITLSVIRNGIHCS